MTDKQLTFDYPLPQVFGILGRKRHGKDTFSRFMSRARRELGITPEYTIVHFAGELKRQAGIVFGLNHEQLDGHDKEKPLEQPITMDDYLDAMRRESGLAGIQAAGMVARTPREVMQYLGTEYVRRCQDSYWIDVVLNKIRECKGYVLVPDTRYPNEAAALRSLGGLVLKIRRLDMPESEDAHSSETAMESIEPDLFLGTITDNFGLQTRVAEALVQGLLSATKRYDYRAVERALAEYDGGATTRDVAELLGATLDEAEFVLSYYKRSCTECLGYRYTDGDSNVWRGQSTEKLNPCQICNLHPDASTLC
jgi:hypothetical protein